MATSTVSPEAGVTGLSALTDLVQRLARGALPQQTIALINPATLIPIQPRPDKIRPIAIGTVLRRLVTKILLPQAISDSRSYLAPFQFGNAVRSVIDFIVHETRRFLEERKSDPDMCILQVDMTNAFNRFSRQRLLNMLPKKAPSLARFLNMLYGQDVPKLIFPPPGVADMESLEGAEQGDPAATLAYSLVHRAIATEIDSATDLPLHAWLCDDGNFGGRHEDIVKVVRILAEKGPELGLHINLSKCRLFWPTDPGPSSTLRAALPEIPFCTDGIVVLGAPVGSQAFTSSTSAFFKDKIDACNTTLDKVSIIGDARTRFHLHRVCASACRLQHAFKLTPPNLSTRAAEKFDRAQLRFYATSNNVPVTSSSPAAHQVRLPLRLGGHGLTPIAPLHYSSYAASLLSADETRLSHQPTGFGANVTAGMHAEADKWIIEFFRRLHPKFVDESLRVTSRQRDHTVWWCSGAVSGRGSRAYVL